METSLFAHASGSSAGSSRRHWPPYHAQSTECYGAYDPPDRRRPPPSTGTRQITATGAPVAALAASRRLCLFLRPIAVRNTAWNLPASCRRPLRPRREPDISPLPSPPARSTEGERCREHQHHRARGERLPSSKTKCYRLEDGRKGSSSGRHCYDDGGRSGSRDRYGDSRHNQELAHPSSCDQGPRYHGDSKRKISLHDHGESVQRRLPLRGKLPLPVPIEMSPWNDGYKSPTSPTYHCEDGLDIERGSHDDDKNETPGWLDSASVSYDGSGIVGRDHNFKNEDPVLKTKEEDSAYNVLLDDFKDAVTKSWRDTNPNITVDKEAHQKQADRFAELALKRYNKNKNNMVKYALVEAIVGASIFEGWELYGHVNFYAKAKNGPKKNDGKVLVFAELQQIGRRPNAMVLTCFQLLDENNHLCGCHDLAPSCRMIQGQDMDHCYACSDRIKHPDGSFYKAGHFVDMLCYHF